MITEQVKLFYSALDEVEIAAEENSLTITEYVRLGLGPQKKYFPFEITRLQFSNNGRYTLLSDLIFQPPKYNKKTLLHLQNTSLQLVRKVEKGVNFSPLELEELSAVPEILLLQETRLDSDIRQHILNIEAKKQKAKNHTIYK